MTPRCPAASRSSPCPPNARPSAWSSRRPARGGIAGPRDAARGDRRQQPTRAAAEAVATPSSALAFRNYPAPTRAAPRYGSTSPSAAGSAQRDPAARQQLHTYSDVNDNNQRASRGDPPVGTAGTTRSSRSTCGRLLLRQPVPVLVGPEHAVLLADQPRPERHPGVLLRQQVARPPGGADRLHRGRRQLPDLTSRARAPAATPSTPRPTTAPTPTPGCPTATTSTTPT